MHRIWYSEFRAMRADRLTENLCVCMCTRARACVSGEERGSSGGAGDGKGRKNRRIMR